MRTRLPYCGELARPGAAHQADGRERGFANPRDARAVTREAMVQSALLSAARAEELGMAKNRIILSAKVSAVQDLIAVSQVLASRSDYAIHLGLTEAAMGTKGIVARRQRSASSCRRASATPSAFADARARPATHPRGAGRPELLQTMGFRTFVCRWSRPAPDAAAPLDHVPGLARSIQDFIRDEMPA